MVKMYMQEKLMYFNKLSLHHYNVHLKKHKMVHVTRTNRRHMQMQLIKEMHVNVNIVPMHWTWELHKVVVTP